MKDTLMQDKWNLIVPITLILFMFCIPLGPTLKSIFFVVAISAVLLTPYYNKNLFYAFNTIWGWAGLVFFSYIAIACLWSPAPFAMQLSMMGKYCKLIYLPIFAIGFINPKVRYLSLNSFLAAIFITCLLCIFKDAGLIEGDDPGEIFYNHIITGFMVAVAAYISGLFAFQYKGKRRLVYIVVLLLTSYQVLFINTGRTGYVVYFLLIAFLFLQKLSFKQAIIGVVLFSGLMLLTYTQSITMQIRVHALVQDIQFFKENNPNTSLGFRIQFHNYAKSLFLQHPVTGIGTAGFKYSFAQEDRIPVWGRELTDPHSQYWMTLSEQGIIGLVLLLTFLGSLFITSFKLKETKPILLGILLAFTAGSVSDTILCYSAAGYLLIVLSALCFGELIEKRSLIKATKRSANSLHDSVSAVQL